jgi:hypothetical protein
MYILWFDAECEAVWEVYLGTGFKYAGSCLWLEVSLL